MRTVKPIQISEGEYANLSENYGGFCVECSGVAYGVEPDARQYECESCGARAVYGVEELLIRGIIRFTEETEQK
mgnify:CR=1 FL=1